MNKTWIQVKFNGRDSFRKNIIELIIKIIHFGIEQFRYTIFFLYYPYNSRINQ